MPRALIVHASRHGGTAGIATRIAQVLRSEGVEAVLAAAAEMPDPRGFDACLVGSGVYMGSWLKEGVAYLELYQSSLARRPVWLFSSGPIPNSSNPPKSAALDPIEAAFGPSEGPGSGGRKRIAAFEATIHPRGHQVFVGAFDPSDPPRVLLERIVRLLPAARSILPAGDFRDWPAIEAWGREIAGEFREAVPVA